MRVALLSSLGVLCAVLAATPSSRARADDVTPAPAPKDKASLVVFPNGVARFNWLHDKHGGSITFRVLDPVRLSQAPVVVLRTAAGLREFATAEQTVGEWVLRNEALRDVDLDGSLRILVGETAYTAPLVVTGAEGAVATPRHGGAIVSFDDCALRVEVVTDLSTGVLTVYPPLDGRRLESPSVQITEGRGHTLLTATDEDVKTSLWTFKSTSFKSRDVNARLRVRVDGKACEASLTMPRHGGHMIAVVDGPQIEIVRGEGGAVLLYAIDDVVASKEYTLGSPQLVLVAAEGTKTVAFSPVAGETRAFAATLPRGPSALTGARLRFTLFDKTIETNLDARSLDSGPK